MAIKKITRRLVPGARVVVRTYSAGVIIGTLIAQSDDGKRVALADSQQVWEWHGAFTVGGLAVHGPTSAKLGPKEVETETTDAIRVIVMSPEAAQRFDSIAPHKP
jgi:hypothetical protein